MRLYGGMEELVEMRTIAAIIVVTGLASLGGPALGPDWVASRLMGSVQQQMEARTSGSAGSVYDSLFRNGRAQAFTHS
jgi:hypothetical protein